MDRFGAHTTAGKVSDADLCRLEHILSAQDGISATAPTFSRKRRRAGCSLRRAPGRTRTVRPDRRPDFVWGRNRR
jgi:hypothetical protein